MEYDWWSCFLLGVCYPTLHYLDHGKGAKTHQVIKAVSTDIEGAFQVLRNKIRENGGELMPKPKNGHLPYAYVKIKIIKELMRTVISATEVQGSY